jgi:Family of unknown function (DUF5681)
MSGDNDVGYRRPPKGTRWKKGQSGNPARRGARRVATTLEIFDKLLLAPIDISENGRPRRVTTLEAILLQLWKKELSGSRRALAVRLKYEELDQTIAASTTEITFADGSYTEDCKASSSGKDDDGKV